VEEGADIEKLAKTLSVFGADALGAFTGSAQRSGAIRKRLR
jgi:hypothetical protein